MKLASPRPIRSALLVEKARAQLKATPLPLKEALARFHDAWKASNGVV
jgi:hypothetical protein